MASITLPHFNSNLKDKSISLSTIIEDDLPFENDLLRDPYSTRPWLRYLDHKLGYLDRVSESHYILVFERAVKTLPGSYRLWKHYLEWCKSRIRKLKGLEKALEANRITGAFKRALLILHKMPRLWTEFLSHLMLNSPHQISLIRTTFDKALQALPSTQHDRIWELYLPWAETIGGNLAVHVHRRHLKMDPSRLTTYIQLLLKLEKYDQAAIQLQKAIRIYAENDRSTYDLFEKLCNLAVDHPESLHLVPVESILRASLRHFPHHTATFWTALARYWISQGRLERARAIFDESIRSVLTVRDFAQLFEAYMEFEESVVTEKMKLLDLASTDSLETSNNVNVKQLEFDIDLRLLRLDQLMEERPLLVNEVMLRQNPNNVKEWLTRVSLYEKIQPTKILSIFKNALKAIQPKHATGHLDELWIAYARYHENKNEFDLAIQVFEKAVLVPFKHIKELSNVWMAYAEMALRHSNVDLALRLLERATAIPANTNVDYHDNKLPPQKRLFKSLPLWNYYVDLEECFGTVATVRSVYDSILELKIANPQVVVNYALYLESHDYFEDSFKVYERGIEFFGWPISFELWNLYLSKFMLRYQATKLERSRELFEMALEHCPASLSQPMYLVYGHMEEKYGLSRRAMRIYERAAHQVPDVLRLETYMYSISRVIHFFGLVAAREVYERALTHLSDAQAPSLALEFAQLELRLGEVERARAIFAHGSQFCDPRTHSEYWTQWHEFEVQYGNEDTFKEMLRIKRSVQAQYNTELNYITAQLAATRNKHQVDEEMEKKKEIL